MREGHSKEAWLKRATDTANFLEKMLDSYNKEGGPDIVALQEVRIRAVMVVIQPYIFLNRQVDMKGRQFDVAYNACSVVSEHLPTNPSLPP